MTPLTLIKCTPDPTSPEPDSLQQPLHPAMVGNTGEGSWAGKRHGLCLLQVTPFEKFTTRDDMGMPLRTHQVQGRALKPQRHVLLSKPTSDNE